MRNQDDRRFHAGNALGLTLSLAMAAAVGISGCRKSEPAPTTSSTTSAAPDASAGSSPVSGTESAPAAVHVTRVDVGKSLGADKRVSSPSETFAPKDTIFASVATEGAAPTATIYAKWTYQDGQVVKSDERAISPKGPAVTEFSIQNPGGWPKGGYRVDVSVGSNGTAVSKSFRVE